MKSHLDALFCIQNEESLPESGVVAVVKVSGHTLLVPHIDDDWIAALDSSFLKEMAAGIANCYPCRSECFPGGLLLYFPNASDERATCVQALNAILFLSENVQRFNAGKDVTVSFKAGICSGQVMPMPRGIPSERHPGILGDAIRRAMELCDFARTKQILVCDSLQAHAANDFVFQMLDCTLGGSSAKVHALLEKIPGRIESECLLRPNGTLPLVGRSEELSLFRDLLGEVRGGHGQIVEVIGEPGIGKTRLLREVCEGDAQDFVQWSIACTPHSRYVNFNVFGELIRRVTLTTREDDSSQARKKLEVYLKKMNGAAEFVPTELLLGVMGFPNSWGDMPTVIQKRHATIRGIIDFVKVSALRRPVLLILDDLHNVDPSSEEVIQELIREVPDCPVLLALVYRSGCEPIWDHNGQNQTLIEVQPLSSDQAKSFLKSVLNTDSVSESHFEQALTLRDEWNPLLIEQLVRKILTDEIVRQDKNQAILDPDVDNTEFTDDLLALIEGRVNSLGQGVRNLLEFSAIIGLSFTIPMLQFLENAADGLREKLSILEGLGFLRKAEDHQGLEYVFHHALTQEVVYDSLDKEHKKSLHARVCRAMVSLYGEDNDSHVETIAYHAVQAELPRESIRFLEKCVEKACNMYSNREAIEYYGQIIKCLISYTELSDESEKIVHCFLKRAELSRYIGDFDEALYDLDQALRTAEVLNDSELLASVYKEKALLAATTGDYAEGMANIQMAKKYIAPSGNGNASIRMRLANIEGIIAWRRGDFSQARMCFERVVGLSHYNGDTHYVSNAYNNLGLIHSTQGRLMDSLDCHREALQLRKKASDLRGQAASCNNIGVVEENLGNYETAEQHYLESLKLSQVSGFKEAETAVLANLGQLSEILGKYSLAIEYNARSIEVADYLSDVRSKAIACDNMGNAYLACDDGEKAGQYYAEALELAESIGDQDVCNRATLGLCFLALRNGDPDKAEDLLVSSERIIQDTGIEDARPRYHRASAEVHLLRTETQKAMDEANTAKTLAETLGFKREAYLSEQLLAKINETL